MRFHTGYANNRHPGFDRNPLGLPDGSVKKTARMAEAFMAAVELLRGKTQESICGESEA
jgi:hypothetical protein